jgi:glycosyltransferase involved in cell wall biosynthesis
MDDNYTVVIPVLNGATFIGTAIRSILGQTIPPQRVIVIDDGSTDQTAAQVRNFGGYVELISQNNSGPGAASTHGMTLVETRFMAFIDADDLWMQNKAALQLRRLEADPALDGVFAHAVISRTGKPPFAGLPTAPIWGRTSLMVRTKSALWIGPVVDPPSRRGEMIDWIARGRAMGAQFEMMDEALAVRRVHEGSLTYRRGSADVGYLAAARASIHRRRAGGGKGSA